MISNLIIGILGCIIGILICAIATWLPSYLEAEEQIWVEQFIKERQLTNANLVENESSLRTRINLRSKLYTIIFFDLWLSPFNYLIIALVSCMGVIISNATGMTVQSGVWVIFVWVLLLLALIDIKTSLLPDLLTLPLMWLGILIQLSPDWKTVGIEQSILGVIFAYLPLWIMTKLYFLFRHQHGLGYGDLKLLAAIGAWLGPSLIPPVLFLASVFALLYRLYIFLVYRRGARHEPFPFGPWIVIAAVLMLVLFKLG